MHNLQVYKVKAGRRLAKLRNEQEDFLFYKTFKAGCKAGFLQEMMLMHLHK
jgi:hypothetical protein